MPYGQSYGMGAPMGDPFLGGLLKGIVKGVSTVGRAALSVAGINVAPKPPTSTIPFINPQAAYPAQVKTPGISGAAQRLIPGGATGYQACPKGYHPDKQTGTRCVRNRRMNPANGQALRRALRREEAFIRLARRTGLVTVPKAKRVRRAASKRR